MTHAISNKIKVYNLILILFIFMYHSDAKYYFKWSNLPYVMGSFGLAFFFMTSGYFMFRGMNGDNAIKRSLKRIKTVFLPYAFWNLLFFSIFLIRDKNYRKIEIKTFLYRFFFQPYNEVLWYLFALFVFSILAFIVYRIISNKTGAALFIAVLSVLVLVFCIFKAEAVVGSSPIGWWIVKIFPYMPIYYFGGVAAIYFEKHLSSSVKAAPVFILLSAVIIVLKWKYDHILVLGWALLFVAPIIFWYAVPEKAFEKGDRIINALCEPSFLIYEAQLLAFWIWQSIYDGHISDKGTYEKCVCISALISIYIVFYLSKLLLPHLLAIATGFRSGKDFTRGKER